MKDSLSINKNSFGVTVFSLIFSTICLIILALLTLLTPTLQANAESVESDLHVNVDAVLEMIVQTCDSSNNSVVSVEVNPSTNGTFKSNCQNVSVHTNNPGYSLSIYHRNGLPPIETPSTIIGIICSLDLSDTSHSPLFPCKDESSNTLCLVSEADADPETLTIPCKELVTQNEICRIDMNTAVPPDLPCEGETTSIITTYSGDLAYQNPTTIDPKPTIASTTNPMTSPNIITNDTWGFAVENLSPFDSIYAIDNNNNNNNYAELPVENTTIYQEANFPIDRNDFTFYYSTRLTPATMAGTYATTITYTAVGEPVTPVPCGGGGICIEITNPGELWLSNLWTSAITYTINGSDPITIEAATSTDDFNVSIGDIIEIAESIDNTTFRSWAGPQFGVDINHYCGLASTFLASNTTASVIKMPAMSRFTTDTAGTTAGDYFFASFAGVCYESPSVINSLPNNSFDTSRIITVGDDFFSSFNDSGVLTSLPTGSFNTSNITTVGDKFFSSFNSTNGSLTSLPSGSFNTSNITTVGSDFFSNFNNAGSLSSLPAGSFDTSNITTVGNRFFLSFNSTNGSLTSLPSGSFNTSNITTVGNSFFMFFNSSGSLTSLPSGSFDISSIASADDYFFYNFNNAGSLTSLPSGSFNTSNITTAGDYVFSSFNSRGYLSSLPAGSFDTSSITTVGSDFFNGFNNAGSLSSLPAGSFGTSSITTVGNNFFSYFNSSGSLTTLPLGSFDTSNITKTGNNFFFRFNGSSADDAGKLQAGTGVIITNKYLSPVVFWQRPFGDPDGVATSTNVLANGAITFLAQ